MIGSIVKDILHIVGGFNGFPIFEEIVFKGLIVGLLFGQPKDGPAINYSMS
jgi:hypothetical protein